MSVTVHRPLPGPAASRDLPRGRPLPDRPAVRRGWDFRADIEGLRAVAVLSVMVYHVAPGLLPGGFVGVDIFFVISGFLITSHLASEHVRTGKISLPRFYARRALRLIPAATVTLVGTAVAVVLFVPRAFWAQFGGDLIASAFYGVNWTLAHQSVDYLAEDNAVSPVQHFWSLAVEEQYYLIWPVLMLAAAFLAGQFKQTKRRGYVAMAVLVTVASAGWAMFAFQQQNPAAYFVTTTRLWELAAGSLVAIIYPLLVRSASGKAVTTLVGLAAILASVWLIRELQWPSPWAFLPIAGTALVLGAGGGISTTWAERVLGIAPLVWIGGLSYSLYLWHWPVVVVAEQVLGKTGVLQGVAIFITSFLLAWLTRLLVENPMRFHPRLRGGARNGIRVGLVGALLSAAAGGALMLAGSTAAGERAVRAPGAAVLRTPISDTPVDDLGWIGEPMTPLPSEAPEDVPSHHGDDCMPPAHSADVRICTYGDRRADRTIAMIGDSKIMQWQPAIERIAEQRHYKLILITKNSCAFADAPASLDGRTAYPACDRWRGPAFAAIKRHKPEVVFTGQGATGAFPLNASSQRRLTDGLAHMYARLRTAGFTTVILGDNRSPERSLSLCLQMKTGHPPEWCTFTRQEAASASSFPLQSVAVAESGGTRVNADGELAPGKDKDLVLVDMMDAFCPPQLERCPPVIGNVLIYRQGRHITATYIGTLTKRLDHALDEAGIFD
ncbi:MAG TPA: acyltransferase family protein [Aeromicrobium sp.]|nr:acyltransferase family protein [Aeromicrobium sp.]